MKALFGLFVALGLAAYLTRTWALGDAAAVMVVVLVTALALIAWRSERVPVVEPDRAKVIAALEKLQREKDQREIRNFMAITSVRRSDQ